MSDTIPKDTVESVIEKLEKAEPKDDGPSTTIINSTSILGEKQSEEDLLAAFGLLKKK